MTKWHKKRLSIISFLIFLLLVYGYLIVRYKQEWANNSSGLNIIVISWAFFLATFFAVIVHFLLFHSLCFIYKHLHLFFNINLNAPFTAKTKSRSPETKREPCIFNIKKSFSANIAKKFVLLIPFLIIGLIIYWLYTVSVKNIDDNLVEFVKYRKEWLQMFFGGVFLFTSLVIGLIYLIFHSISVFSSKSNNVQNN